jgi:choline dehydrogenase-like flavoprotein
LAGRTAARSLAEAGRSVVVLEPRRDRPAFLTLPQSARLARGVSQPLGRRDPGVLRRASHTCECSARAPLARGSVWKLEHGCSAESPEAESGKAYRRGIGSNSRIKTMPSAVSVPAKQVQIMAGEGSLFIAVTTTIDTMPAKARKPRAMNMTSRMN